MKEKGRGQRTHSMVVAAPDDEEPTGEAWRIMDLAEGLACERFPPEVTLQS